MQTSRNFSRLVLVQALYQDHMSPSSEGILSAAKEIIQSYKNKTIGSEFDINEDIVDVDMEFLESIAGKITDNQEAIDKIISSHLKEGWNIDRVEPILLSILRSAVCELLYLGDIPLKVIINEYVSVTKDFYDRSEIGFVNGILDKISKEVR